MSASVQAEQRGRRFDGLPEGKLATTSLPSLLFTELVTEIDDLAELKLTLHIFWTLVRHPRRYPGFRQSELANDALLTHSLGVIGGDSKDALVAALDRAVTRGTLLRIHGRWKDKEETWFFVNSPKGREAVDRLARSEGGFEPTVSDMTAPAPSARRNIFVLYEQNVGLLQPIIAEELAEAEETYPAEWIEDAFRTAAEGNVRNWRYIRAILERWAVEGKDNEADRRYS
jgi:DNA replication protein